MKPSNILLEIYHGGHEGTEADLNASLGNSPCLRALRGKTIIPKISDFGLVRLAGEQWLQSQAEHKTNTVSFEVDGSVPPVRFVIRYDTAGGLQRRGVGCAIPPMWSSHPDNKQSASQLVGDMERFNRDAERRRKEAESKGFGARLKKWFGG